MPPYHFTSTSRALYRVFVAPTLSVPFRNTAIPAFQSGPQLLLPHITVRTKTFKKVKRQALTDIYTVDNAIKAAVVNVVDSNGIFQREIPVDEVRYDRKTEYLLQVTPDKLDGSGKLDPSFVPTCKIVSKMDLRQQLNRKLEIERRQAKGQGAGPSMKNLELNWAIAPGDLKHRLNKLKEFLLDGRKVEILMGSKRGGKKATEKECLEVLEKVREAVSECKGAWEVKDPEGKLGGTMTLVFEGKFQEREKKPEEETRQVKKEKRKAAAQSKQAEQEANVE
ncbi:hypothetical protein BS50DRAFT_574716 [Corynespora cassiicola Philippines]|uniref:Translation initiation factor 3 N-terminal domain-containing protein n=1 Tax=Corynespora cassiicola Philippines TaxID=1448308 RepID=A0A2T2NLE2_CORCC|nr:hypothetical protein BS50DRAFT_574716 [Corynespora cassiicola Philippines]